MLHSWPKRAKSERLKEEVAVAVTRDYNKLERTRSMVNVATQVAQLRQESERLATNQATQGVVLTSNVRQATAANYEAKAELLQARLGYLLAWAELERTIVGLRDWQHNNNSKFQTPKGRKRRTEEIASLAGLLQKSCDQREHGASICSVHASDTDPIPGARIILSSKTRTL